MNIIFGLNNTRMELDVAPEMRLLDLLRDVLGLTGTKESCGQGECGACTVIMNGVAVNSCLVMAGQIDGAEIITIEGLEQNGELDVLQKSFLDHNVAQCGFCTPGMIMSCKALLMKNPNPTTEEIKHAIAGNICRCGSYPAVIEAVKDAAVMGGEQNA